MADFYKLYDSILNGDNTTAASVTREAVAEGAAPTDLVAKYMVPAMDEVGRRFERQDCYIPELMLSARAMKSALEILRPLLNATMEKPAGRIVIGTVQGDLHDIGKNLVASMLEGGGFEVLDLGTDVPPEKFVDAVKSRQANVVALSALLTTTMPAMQKTIQALKTAGVREQVKVIVGGPPLNPEYAKQIGADGYGESAPTAVALVRELGVYTRH